MRPADGGRGRRTIRPDELVPALQAAVGPVILVSGVGLLLLSMTNRFGRVVDRARLLAAAPRAGPSADRDRAKAQLGIIACRALLRRAIILATLCVLFAAVLVIGLSLITLSELAAPLACAGLFVASLACLILSLVYFLRDINLSLIALEMEVRAALGAAAEGTERPA